MPRPSTSPNTTPPPPPSCPPAVLYFHAYCNHPEEKVRMLRDQALWFMDVDPGAPGRRGPPARSAGLSADGASPHLLDVHTVHAS